MDKKNIKITVIGLGYVGLPLAIEFNKNFSTIGFDLDKVRIDELNNQYDRTNELSEDDIDRLKNLFITANQSDISQSNVYVVTVPTPVDKNNKPDLKPLIKASEMIGKYLKKNDRTAAASGHDLFKRARLLQGRRIWHSDREPGHRSGSGKY